MIKAWRKILISSLCGLLFSTVGYSVDTPPPISATPNAESPLPIIPAAPKIDAKAYVLMDADSGKILAEKNMDQKRPPASLTKLMTLYVTSAAIQQQQVKLTDKVRISKDAWQRGGSRMFVNEGSNVTVHDLIKGIIVASGNDACVALAEYIGGSESSFAELMNQFAARLGMKNSHYVDSTGLPKAKHYSTAHDIATLAQALINDFPEDYAWYKDKWINYNNIKQPNRNRLLWRDPSVDGLKTGHTQSAGYCLVSSAKRNGMRLISVVMGAPSDSSRTEDSQALLNWGFRFYETHQLYSKNSAIQTPRTWLGENKTTPIGVAKDFYITVPKNTYSKLKSTLKIAPQLTAPIAQNQNIGTLEITLNDKEIATSPVIALQDNPTGSWWSGAIDRAEMIFTH